MPITEGCLGCAHQFRIDSKRPNVSATVEPTPRRHCNASNGQKQVASFMSRSFQIRYEFTGACRIVGPRTFSRRNLFPQQTTRKRASWRLLSLQQTALLLTATRVQYTPICAVWWKRHLESVAANLALAHEPLLRDEHHLDHNITDNDYCGFVFLTHSLSLSLSLSFHYFCLFVVFMLFSLLCCDHHPSNLKPSTLSSKPAFSLRDRKTSQGIEHDLVSITRSRSQLDALGSLTVRLPRSRPSGWRVAAGCRSYASAAPACQSDERYMLHLTRHFTCYFFLTQNDCISITLPAFVANTFFRACNEQQYHI